MNTGQAAGIVVLTFSAIVASQPEGYLVFAMVLLVLGAIILAGTSMHKYRLRDHFEMEAKFDDEERRRSLAEKGSEINGDTLGRGTSEWDSEGLKRGPAREREAPWQNQSTGGRLKERERLVGLYHTLDDEKVECFDIIGKQIADANRRWMNDMLTKDYGPEHAKWQEIMKEKGYGYLPNPNIEREAMRQKIEEEWDDYVSWTS